MGLLSGFNVTLPEIEILGQAARAAFSGAAIPNGWSVLTPQQLGLAPQYWDGLYFTDNGASAIVLQQGNSIIVSFRGTDSTADSFYYPELLFGTYINRFQPLLTAIAAQAPGDTHFYFTGTSLGGGAVNQMADIASYEYAGRFAAAQFVAFASPTVANANGILNFGFENDPIYKVLENYSDQPSSLDNLVLATAKYMAGNYDGQHPLDYYAHSSSAFDVIGRLKDSVFYDFMSPDSVLIFDAYSGPVTDLTPGRESSGAFYLGEAVADQIIGRAGGDFIEGFADDDTLSGAAGNDRLDGGAGNDIMVGGTGNDTYTVDSLSDVIIENTNEGTDAAIVFANNYTLASNVENGNAGLATGQRLTGNGLANALVGNSGDDILDGGGGLDQLTGDGGYDTFVFAAGEADGDEVLDFSGNGALAGDSFRFVGFGTAAGGATFTQIGATQWQIHSGLDGHNEVITLLNGASVHASDSNDVTVQINVAARNVSGDFNGDGNSDVLWRHDSGQVYIWEMDGLQVKAEGTVAHAPVTNDWHVQGIGDFNADDNSDVLWRHDSGQVYIWEMDGLGTKAEGTIAHAAVPNDWHVQGTGDFDGDGKSDVLWRHDTGQVYIWEMDGLGTKAEGGVAHAAVPNDWHIQGTGDFDGDGNSDVLWCHDTGQVYIWEMDGLGTKAEGTIAHAAVPNDWHVQGTGDFDGDGKSDLLWRHDSGQVYIWEMDGLNVKAEGTVVHAPVTNDWHVQGIGDFNGDTNSDILWRHDSGQVYFWEMDGLGIKAEGSVAHAAVPNDWHILA
jgi:Ca2+-binding RTX toxin-like protein